MTRWLNRREAAAYLGISPNTLTKWTSERVVASVRRGQIVRYDIHDLDQSMESAKRRKVGK